MPVILCYGDSNTWGYIPSATPDAAAQRYDRNTRWPGVVSELLGSDYQVLENGLCGRTTAFDDPVQGAHLNGRPHLPVALGVAAPVDLLVIMLGTNDLKTRFNATAGQIANNVGTLVEMARVYDRPSLPVLVICPPKVTAIQRTGWHFAGAPERSQQLPQAFGRMAVEKNVPWLDAGDFIVASNVDGIHLEAGAHRLLGEVVADKVSGLL